MQTAALRHIEQVDPGLPVMRVPADHGGEPWAEVPGPDGRTYPVRLFTFLPGQVSREHGAHHRGDLVHGQITARLGRALRGFFHPAADYEILWDITRLAHAPPAAQPCLRRRRAGLRWNGFWTGSRPGSRRRCPGCVHR